MYYIKHIVILFFVGWLLLATGFAVAQSPPDAVVFRAPEGVYIRWPGHSGADFEGYILYRQLAGGSWERITEEPLRIVTSWDEIERQAGRLHGSMYLSLFGITDSLRDVSDREKTMMLTPSGTMSLKGLLSITQAVIGQLLGEVYTDRSIPPGTPSVRYRVTIFHNDGSETEHAATQAFDPRSFDSIPRIDSLQGFPRDRAAMLAWFKDRNHLLTGEITSYNLYRAPSWIGPFEQVNASGILPIEVSSGTLSSGAGRQTHLDRFLENGKAYYYHVRGSNSFGLEGPASETIKVVPGDHEPPPAPFGIEGEIYGAAARLSWQYTQADRIKGFEVYRSENRDGPYKKAFPRADLQMQPGMRQWHDLEVIPGGDTYYYMHAIGINQLRSNASDTLSFHYHDLVAPAPPQNVVATADTGRIIISWTPNTERDLYGYEIERAGNAGLSSRFLLGQEKDGGYTSLITDTFYIDPFPVQTRTLFGYRVYALDRSMNRSVASEMATARLVDVSPPLTPVIQELSYDSSGIYLRWSESPDPDTEAYLVYHSYADSTQFVLASEQPGMEFREQPDAEGIWYYRLSARDDSGNESHPGQIVWIEVQAGPPLPPPSGRATWNGNLVELSWEESPSDNVAGYFIQRYYTETGRRIDLTETSSEVLRFADRYARRGDSFVYLIYARDADWRMGEAVQVIVE